MKNLIWTNGFLRKQIRTLRITSLNSRERDAWIKKPWKEWYGKEYTFYCGFFSKGDFRIGGTIGNKEGSLDIGIWTIGYIKM